MFKLRYCLFVLAFIAGCSGPKPTSLTLDYHRFLGPAREAYQIAEEKPALLKQLHCYCGCDKEIGHTNLFDCFRDEHSSHCPICTGEALIADRLDAEGKTVDQIKYYLSQHFKQE